MLWLSIFLTVRPYLHYIIYINNICLVLGNNIICKFLNAYFSFFLNLFLKINDNKIIYFQNSPDCTLEISRILKVIKTTLVPNIPFDH